jgi:TRAP-type C4-dicarboxylate transport system permease small subunit
MVTEKTYMRQSDMADRTFTALRISQLWASHITLLIMVGALALQIIAREFHLQVDWTEELSRFSFVAMVFVGASYASQMGSHLRVSAFADLMARWRPLGWLIPKLEFLAVLTFDCLFFWYCIGNLIDGLRYKNASPALNFNENLLFIAPLIGFGVAILYRMLGVFFTPPTTTGMAMSQDVHP